jgi:Protein of unknown function DUF262
MSTDVKSDIPEITPQVIHLIDLLAWAREGRLRIPVFQREFIWSRQDILDLLDSISRQFPIGALFFWRTESAPSHLDHIGPLRLPGYQGPIWLVLDGQQRLTALVGTLLSDDPLWDRQFDSEDPRRWYVYFDSRPEGGFIHARSGEPVPASYIPAPALLDTMKLFKEVDRIRTSETHQDSDDWIERAQRAARAIQGYRIPIVLFTSNDLGVVVESFARINSRGRTISQDQMLSALTFEEDENERFYLAEQIDRLQNIMVRSGFGEIHRTTLLRSVLTAARLDVHTTDWTRLGEQIKSDVKKVLPSAVDQAAAGLERSLEFLRDLGVLNTRILPYGMQLVALSAFFGRCAQPTDEQKKLLRRWFWCSSFVGWIGTGSPLKVRCLIEELRDRLPNEPLSTTLDHMDLSQPALSTPLRFDLRSARVRALICVLLRRLPKRPDATPLTLEEAARLLLERGPDAMSVVCATVTDPILRRSPANRIFDVAPDVPGQAKNWLLEIGPAVRDDVLDSLAIPPESFSWLAEGRHDAFLQRRMELFGQLEREFMREVRVTPPTSAEPALSPMDTEDEMPAESS